MITPKVPKAASIPILGSALHVMGRDPRAFLLQQYRKLGPVFRIQAFHINYVIMAGPSANAFINGEGFDAFQSQTFWKGMMQELEADNFLIGLDGEDHKFLRKLFRSNFSKAAAEPYRETLATLCKAMFEDLEEGQTFKVVERILQLTSQMIGSVMTGKVPSREELEYFLYYTNTITNHFTLQRLPAWALKFRGPKLAAARNKTMDFADGVIDEYLTGTSMLHNFVDAVMSAAKKCPHLFSQGDVRFSAILPLFVGIDTLGQTINYALYELHKHPHILSQLRTEIQTHFDKEVPNITQMKAMPIMNSVIMETLRLHPSAFGIVRTANRDFEFEGYTIPKGQDVVILTTASHFMEAYFKEPDRFDIKRYNTPRNEHHQRHVYAPFGGGPHACLGATMAEYLMGIALGSILKHYTFEPLDPNLKIKERINPTPSLGDAFQLKLLKKKS